MKLALRISSYVWCAALKKLIEDHVLPLSKGNGLKPGNAVIFVS
jgi:hypothetical protein